MGHRSYTKTKWGNRDFAALISLRDKGLVVTTGYKSYTDQPYHAYGTDYWTEFTFVLTAKGIEVAKGLEG